MRKQHWSWENPSKPIRATLTPGHTESFTVTLSSGDYMSVAVDKPWFPIAIQLRAAERSVVELNLGPGQRLDRLRWIADSSGDYRVELSAPAGTGTPSPYNIKLEDRHPAGDEDKQRVEVQRLFERARIANEKREYQDTISNSQKALALTREVREPESEATALYIMGRPVRASATEWRELFELG